MSEIPPIPPDCEIFSEAITPHVIHNCNRTYRPIVACVCRCGWLDEAERFKAMSVALFANPEALAIHYEKYAEAMANSEL